MGDLPTSTLEDMCEFVIDCPHFTPEWTDSGFIVIRNQNIRDGRLDLSNPSFTHHDDFLRRIKRAKPQAGDIIFTREAPMGEVCMVPEGLECCVGQRQVLLRPRRGIDGRYLFFALRSHYVRHQIFWNEGTGSTVSNVRIPVLKSLKIPRLGNSESTIAVLLGALDDKIELNRQTNENLEAMARAIFKDWFVDFGPTRAKAEGCPPYLAPEIWELFPDTVDDDDKPMGWKKRVLGDVVSVTKGRSYKSAELQDSDTALVTLKSFQRGGGYRHDGLKSYTGRYKSEQVVSPGELIVALTDVTQAADVIGKPAIVRGNDSYQTLVASLDVGILRSRSEQVGLPWLYYLLRTEDFQSHIYGHCSGTTVLHLSKQGIPSFKATMPPPHLLSLFDDTANSLFSRATANDEEALTLSRMRDLLLPKLMSGEIRLRYAEKAVEAIA